jgi:pyruvate dehydrogenase E2 component (dihydrolipoamide acetyltransferase)
MAVRVLMPKGADTMTEGKVLKWLKAEGEGVSVGSAIVEIETDKVDMEVEATGDGVLRKILVPAGQTVPVGQILAIVGAPGEDISGLLASGGSVPNASFATAATSTSLAPEASSAPITTSVPASLSGELTLAGCEKILPEAPVRSERVTASPLARRIAREKGIDLSRVTGRGPGGRIIGGDVERAMVSQFGSPPASISPTQAGQAPPDRSFSAPGPAFRDESLSSMRKTIATRLTQSLGPVPHFYLTIEVDMRRAKELRQAAVALDPELKLTYNDIIVKACAVALRKHPEVNASFLADRIRFHNRIHIGIAVAVDEGGLLMPIVRDCDQKTLQQISRESKELVARIRARKLSPEEYAGATFSVSNLGMMGIDEFSAVINPPEGAILAVGKVLEKAVVSDGRVTIGHRCRMTLSCDHRVMDGATGAKFLHTLRGLLESNPGNQPSDTSYATI